MIFSESIVFNDGSLSTLNSNIYSLGSISIKNCNIDLNGYTLKTAGKLSLNNTTITINDGTLEVNADSVFNRATINRGETYGESNDIKINGDINFKYSTIGDGTSVTINGDVILNENHNENVIEHGAELIINGNLQKTTYSYDGQDITSNGLLEIEGNVDSVYNYVSIKQTNDNSKLIIKGNAAKLDINNLKAGTAEIGGDVNTTGAMTGTGQIVLNGDALQTVSSLNVSALILENKSNEGVVFSRNINVTTLFNHNGNNFTLYNNGNGSSFVDYDGDGLKDNVDPYPVDANNKSYNVIGDANGDYKLNIRDVTTIQMCLVEMINLSVEQKELADFNGDGKVSIRDATLIQMYLAGMIETLR